MAKATTTTAAAKGAPTAAPKAASKDEIKKRMRIGRTLGRGVWLTGYKVEHPDASKEDRNLAWKEARKDFTQIGLKALKTLEKSGYEVVEQPDS